jgi:transposase-like protein
VALMELEVTQYVGAERHERRPERTGQFNGHREREWDTPVGTIKVRVPRIRDGGSFPSLQAPRRRAERTLVGVETEAYVQGISTTIEPLSLPVNTRGWPAQHNAPGSGEGFPGRVLLLV